MSRLGLSIDFFYAARLTTIPFEIIGTNASSDSYLQFGTSCLNSMISNAISFPSATCQCFAVGSFSNVNCPNGSNANPISVQCKFNISPMPFQCRSNASPMRVQRKPNASPIQVAGSLSNVSGQIESDVDPMPANVSPIQVQWMWSGVQWDSNAVPLNGQSGERQINSRILQCMPKSDDRKQRDTSNMSVSWIKPQDQE